MNCSAIPTVFVIGFTGLRNQKVEHKSGTKSGAIQSEVVKRVSWALVSQSDTELYVRRPRIGFFWLVVIEDSATLHPEQRTSFNELTGPNAPYFFDSTGHRIDEDPYGRSC
jgi:hypothetical protein